MGKVLVAIVILYGLFGCFIMIRYRNTKTCPRCYYPQHRCECEEPGQCKPTQQF